MTFPHEPGTADVTSAAALMQDRGEASVCLLQRHYKLGYAAAAHLFDQVKLAGLIKPNLQGPPAQKTDMTAVRRVVAAARSGLTEGERDRMGMTGALLYSQLFSLTRGEAYILGTNPGGGDEGKQKMTSVLDRMESGVESCNDYLDDDTWDTRQSRQLQSTIKALLHLVAPGRERTVCAANLVFVRSSTVKALEARTEGFWALADACWPAHEVVLDVVRPMTIVAYGNGASSAYAYLLHRFRTHEVQVEEEIHAGWGQTKLKAFSYFASWGRTRVVGLPHPSRFGLLATAGVQDEIGRQSNWPALRSNVADFLFKG